MLQCRGRVGCSAPFDERRVTASATLAEGLDSLLGQTFTDFELLIGDNASSYRGDGPEPRPPTATATRTATV